MAIRTMKSSLRTLFSPILNTFESGDESYHYKPSQRSILLAVSSLFSFLTIVICVFSWNQAGYGFLIPVLVFISVALVGFVVALLGSDRAVAKIWGNK